MSNWKWLKNAKRNKMSESFYLFYAIAHQTFFTVIINFLKMPFAVVIFMKYFRCTAKTLQNIRTSFRLHIKSYSKLKIVSIVIFYKAFELCIYLYTLIMNYSHITRGEKLNRINLKWLHNTTCSYLFPED